MSPELLKKKFSIELDTWMNEEGLDRATTAWLLNCTQKTVDNWLNAKNFPGRNNAVLLAHFAPALRVVVHQLVGLPEAATRMKEHKRNGRLRAVA